MGKRRTNPAYLSNDEAARDRRRTVEFVTSIAGSKQVNADILGSKEVIHAWYADRLCDSCGTMLQMSSWRCKKCDVCFCYKCGKEIRQIQKRIFACCPMCDGRLE